MMRNNPESWIHRVAAELRRPVRLDDEFDRGVMDAVRAMPRHRQRPWTHMLRTRTITVSPIVRTKKNVPMHSAMYFFI